MLDFRPPPALLTSDGAVHHATTPQGTEEEKNIQPSLTKRSPSGVEAWLGVMGSVDTALIKGVQAPPLPRVDIGVVGNGSILCWNILFGRSIVVVNIEPVVLDNVNILGPVPIVSGCLVCSTH
jgi:hypothetical protein